MLFRTAGRRLPGEIETMNLMPILRLLAAGAVAVSLSSWPSRAETGVQDLTCGQFLARDDAGRDKAAADLLQWVACEDTCRIAGSLLVLLYDMTEQQVRQVVEDRCLGQPAGTNIVARLTEDL